MSLTTKVPFIEHNGQTIKESVAAVKYLTNINNIPDHWYPKVSRGNQNRMNPLKKCTIF